MLNSPHPAAPEHLPAFITAPGETDVLFVVMVVIVALAIALIGVFYFRLHALPEHMAHRTQKTQYEIVAVLALISLFTHNHIYWIAGLLLALVPLPDFSTPLTRIADSLARLAGGRDRVETKPLRQEPLPTSPEVLPERPPKPSPVKELRHA
jgi:hypothetical protein